MAKIEQNTEKSIKDMSDEEVVNCMSKLCNTKFDFMIGRRLLAEFNCDIKNYIAPIEVITYEHPKGTHRTWKWKQPSDKGKDATEGMAYVKRNLPFIAKLSSILLNSRLLGQQHVFYVDGNKDIINIFISMLENLDPLVVANIDDYGADLGGVFKKYIANIPVPLLTDDHYNAYACLVQHYNNLRIQSRPERFLRSVQLYLLLLPIEYRELLKHVIAVLHTMVKIQGEKKAVHLSRIFVIHLVCPRLLPPEAMAHMIAKMHEPVQFMIATGMDIFNIPVDLVLEIRTHFVDHRIKYPADWQKRRFAITFGGGDDGNQNSFVRMFQKLATCFK